MSSVPPVPPPPTTRDHTPGLSQGGWSSSGTGSRLPFTPRRSPVYVAGGLVLALIVGATGYLLLRPHQEEPTGPVPVALVLALNEGQHLTYRLDASLLGTTTAGLRSTTEEQRLRQTLEWEVASQDASGLADVEIRTADGRFRMGGRSFRQDPLLLRIQITPDGRILTGANLGITTGEVGGPGVPGMDQFLPVLPDRPVVPGDTWSTYFEQSFRFAPDVLPYSVEGRFLRYGDLGGTRTVIVENTTTLPIDLRLNLRKLAAASGLSADLPAGVNPSFVFSGHADLHQTGWFDPSTGSFLKATSTEEFVMTLRVKGIRTGLPRNSLQLQGTLNVDVRLEPTR